MSIDQVVLIIMMIVIIGFNIFTLKKIMSLLADAKKRKSLSARFEIANSTGENCFFQFNPKKYAKKKGE